MFFNAVVFTIMMCIIGTSSSRHYNVKKQSLGRIVGGVEIPIEQRPYQVSIDIIDAKNHHHYCSGSIIKPNSILTAAHCFLIGDPFVVRTGSTSYKTGGQQSFVRTSLIHELFDANTYNYDIAIIKISRGFNMNDQTSIIKLAPIGYEIKDGSLVTVAGWGAISENGPTSNKLMEMKLHVVSIEKCQQYYEKSEIKNNTMICAAVNGGIDSCKGDSGAPLVNSKGIQIGIVSYGKGCGKKDYPGVYTKISYPDIRRFIKYFT